MRRSFASVFALALAAMLSLPGTLPALAQTSASTLTATVSDGGMTLTGASSAITLGEDGSFGGELVIDQSLSDGISVESLSLTVRDVEGPGDVDVTVGVAAARVGTAVAVGPGATQLGARFDAPGQYAVTFGMHGQLATMTAEGVSSTPIDSNAVVLSFVVPAPVVPDPLPEADQGADAEGDEVSRAVGATIGPAPAIPSPSSEGAGSAPASRELRILADVHTDAVSTFSDAGDFALGTKADVDGVNGTRFDPETVRFHVDADAVTTLPAGFDFVGPEGSSVWIAPESNPGGDLLWPGFSTESVAAGAVDGNQTTFTLTGFSGPGDLEVYTGGGSSSVTRLWSTDEGIAAFTVGRTHMHANWAFTAAGSYRLAVEATATISGSPVSATAVYTFVVGSLPAPIDTTTTLSVSDAEITTDEQVTLTATVQPAGVAGHVEFRDGATALWHAPAVAGDITYTTTLPVGARALTAAFVPSVVLDAAASTSTATPVAVTAPGGEVFAISGVQSSYQPGDRLDASIVGHTLGEGQTYRWLIRAIGQTGSDYVFYGDGDRTAAANGQLTQLLGADRDGYEISARLRQGTTNVSQTAWVALVVEDAVTPVTTAWPVGDHYVGDALRLVLSGSADDGDSLRLANRYGKSTWAAYGAAAVEDSELVLRPTSSVTGATWSVQTVRDGLVVAQSAPFVGDIISQEVILEGIRSVYRAGQTLEATAGLHPEFPGARYRWSLFDGATWTFTELGSGSTEADRSIVLPLTVEENGDTLLFEVTRTYDDGTIGTSAYVQQVLTISDATPDEQLLFPDALGGHYHQGYDINLRLIADPEIADDDSVRWQWKWPGSDVWSDIPDAASRNAQLIAEQALAEVEVRAIVTPADGGDPLISDIATIHHDDHGGAARQVISVSGETDVDTGDPVSLTASSAAATVLTDVRWERRAAGADDFEIVEGETGMVLAFDAAEGDDGAEYRASFVTPAGAVGYGPSAAVALEVAAPREMPLREVVLDNGHIDLFELTYDDGRLVLQVKDDSRLYDLDHAFWDPSQVTIAVDQAQSALALEEQLEGYEFLPVGEEFYILDWVQQDGLPWPGWSTERLAATLPAGVEIPRELGAVQLAVEVTGPGDVFIFQSDLTATDRWIDTTDGQPELILTQPDVHYHTTWVFTEPGDYELVVTPSATTTAVGTLTGPAESYHFHVGPRPVAGPVDASEFGASIGGVPAAVDDGTDVELALVLAEPRPEIAGYQWYGPDGRKIPGATEATLSTTVDVWDMVTLALLDSRGRILSEVYANFLPAPNVPHAPWPPLLSLDEEGGNDVTTSWYAPFDGLSPITAHDVRLTSSTGQTVTQQIPRPDPDVYSFTTTFADVPNGSWTAAVRAVNALGAGPWSEPSQAVSIAVPPPPGSAGDRPIALTEGHIDLFEVTYSADAGGLKLSVKDDSTRYGTGSEFHEPEDVTIWVDSARSATVV
uniref:choice-of-anchor M domain-containing protein n=1 Tax=Pseudolysinimonas sp. TaxID=2680009 RepID=UPI0037844847